MPENQKEDVEDFKKYFADLKKEAEVREEQCRERSMKVRKLRIPQELQLLLKQRIIEHLETYPGHYRDTVKDARNFAVEWKEEKMKEEEISKSEQGCFLYAMNEDGQIWHDKITIVLDSLMNEIARRDAINFLAHITSEKQKESARIIFRKWGSSSNKEKLGIFLLGPSIRNSLRMAGFPWDSQILEGAWLDLFSEAVNLPEEKIVISSSIEEAIKRFGREIH